MFIAVSMATDTGVTSMQWWLEIKKMEFVLKRIPDGFNSYCPGVLPKFDDQASTTVSAFTRQLNKQLDSRENSTKIV